MGILFRKLLRDLKEAKGQFIAILVIVTIGVMFYTGMNATFRNLSDSSEKYYREYRLADLWASVYRAPESVLDRINSLPYVEESIGRVVKDVKIEVSDENAIIRLITLPDRKTDIINDISLKSGRYFSENENNQCLLEEEFFKAHNLNIGDYINPVINGSEVRLKVIGTVKSPEYVYLIRDGSELFNDNRKFGVAYIKKSFGQTVFDFNGSINDIAMTLKDDVNIGKAKDDVKKVLDEFGVTSVVERKNQISYRMLNEEIRGMKSFGSVFPVVFLVVAAVIIYIMMGRMVENQRTQIGMLKALGYSNGQVLAHYLTYSVFIGLLGSVIGAVFGMYLGRYVTELENQYFHLPLEDMKIYPELAVPASLLTLFFCVVAGYNACKNAFRIVPAEAMRPKAPKAGKKILVERISPLWSRLDFSWKIILRNLSRYKRRTILTSIGIVFSAMLLLMGFGMQDSINFLMDQQFKNIQNNDLRVDFYDLLNVDELDYIRGLPHVMKVEPMVETGVEISNGWRKKDVGFTALVRNPELYRVADKQGNAVEPPSEGILIPEKLGRTLGAGPGDTVYIKSYLPGKKKREVTVKGTIQQYIGINVYSSMDYIDYILGEGRVAGTAVIKLDSEIYEEEVKEKLKDIPGVSSVQSKNDAVNNIEKSMEAMTAFIGVIVVLAAVLSIAVVYNIATINIFERQKELATLKVLGFKSGEVQKSVFNENYLVTAFSILAALPLGKWFDDYLAATMYETDMYTLPAVKNAGTYILAIILTIAFTVLANFTLRKKISSINMVEALKSNE